MSAEWGKPHLRRGLTISCPGEPAALDATTLVGSLAALATATSFVPQAWKVIRTRDTAALSAGMYALRTLAILLWLAYGLLLGQWPLIATNAVCLALSGFILTMKLLPRRHREAVADALDPTK